MSPQFRAAQTEFGARCGLVPEHLVLQFVRLGTVVDNEALVVLGTLVHDLTKGIKVREHPGPVVIQLVAILNNVFTQDKYIIHVCSQGRWNTHCILHGDDKHGVVMSPVHKQTANILVANPCFIVQTIVHNEKIARVARRGSCCFQLVCDFTGDHFLAL